MAIDPSFLSGISVAPGRVTTYLRQVAPHFEPLRLSTGAGRWQSLSGTLYTATSEAAAWAEYCRYSWEEVDRAEPPFAVTLATITAMPDWPLDIPPHALYTIEGELDRVADLTTAENRSVLIKAGVALDDLLEDNFGPCPLIAATGEALGWEAILAPSAALRPDGETINVLSAGFPKLQAPQLVRVATPTVQLAIITSYRVGKQPGWIP